MTGGEPPDYYRLLGLSRDADAERIGRRIREEHRAWQRQTSHPDLDRRQEAEQRIRHLSDARRVFRDAASRTAYDDRLAASEAEAAGRGKEFARPGEEFAGYGAEFAGRGEKFARPGEEFAGYGGRRSVAAVARPAAEPQDTPAHLHGTPGPAAGRPPEAEPAEHGAPDPVGVPADRAARRTGGERGVGSLLPPEAEGEPGAPGGPHAQAHQHQLAHRRQQTHPHPPSAAQEPEPEPVPATAPRAGRGPVLSAGEWMDQARDALDAADPLTAWQCAREARDLGEDSARVWFLQGVASVSLDRLEQGVFELGQSVRRDPDHPRGHLWLGQAHRYLRQWAEALASFEEVERLAPGDGCRHIARVHLATGRPERAVEALEAAHAHDPGEREVRELLAQALLESAQRVPARTVAGSPRATSAEEIATMRPLVERAARLAVTERQVSRVRAEGGYLEWGARRHFRRPPMPLVLVPLTVAVVGVAFLVHPLLAVPVGLGSACLWLLGCREPGWRTNARAAERP